MKKNISFAMTFAISCVLMSCHKRLSNKVDAPVTVLDTECLSSSSIVGGQKVSPRAPDANGAILLLTADSSGAFLCTAAAISPRVLLTAAHCLESVKRYLAVFHTDLLCESGYRKTKDTREIVDVVANPNYRHNVYSDSNPDLGLILLSEPIPSNYPIFKINLNPSLLNSSLLIYGYGNTSTKADDYGFLRRVEIERANYYYKDQSVVIPENKNKGICTGDSGGSAFVRNNGVLEIAAVTSYGSNVSNLPICAGEGHLSLVYPEMNWIQSVVSEWGEVLK